MIHQYSFERKYIYKFKTQVGSEYSISLEDYAKLLGFPDAEACKTMFISVEKKEKPKGEYDPRTQSTIMFVIEDYLNRYDEIVCYICSNANGRRRSRRRLFLKWFNDLSPRNFRQATHTIDNEEHIFIFDYRNEYAERFLSWLREQYPLQ